MALQRIRLDQIKSNTVNYDNFYEQVEGMIEPFHQEFEATAGQTVFDIGTNYKTGNNSLKVFINGIYAEPDVSYDETSPNRITFNEPLEVGDWVVCRIEGSGSGTTLEDHIHVTREIPFGAINGTNNIFVLDYSPREGKEQVFKNGILQSRGVGEDYTINGNVIKFTTPPSGGSKILVNYIV